MRNTDYAPDRQVVSTVGLRIMHSIAGIKALCLATESVVSYSNLIVMLGVARKVLLRVGLSCLGFHSSSLDYVEWMCSACPVVYAHSFTGYSECPIDYGTNLLVSTILVAVSSESVSKIEL